MLAIVLPPCPARPMILPPACPPRPAAAVASPGHRLATWLASSGLILAAYVACDLLHEGAHLAAARWLPLGVRTVMISTVATSSFGSSRLVAAAGPAFNLLLGAFLAAARWRRPGPGVRVFCWLFGTLNLFGATAYLAWSGLTGTGDGAVALSALPAGLWRPLAVGGGAAAYFGAVRLAARQLQALEGAAVIAPARARWLCTRAYWGGGALLVLAAAFNPVSPWLVLTSGATTGFGSMLGLVWIARRGPAPGAGTVADAFRPGAGWAALGWSSAWVFVFVFGPGVFL